MPLCFMIKKHHIKQRFLLWPHSPFKEGMNVLLKLIALYRFFQNVAITS